MRTEGDFIKINEWLLPLSWLYGIGVRFRNLMFDIGILKSRRYDIPIISVGNITVGGSGKTPHVEYLISLLEKRAKVAVLSRGYKRKSRGYVLAKEDTAMRDIGDEPYQMKKKFGNIHIAVDKDRRHGIERLTSDRETKDTEVILLDDAYQHRYVKAGISILLVDYHRLIIYDRLLPAGRLREPQSGKSRADIVIVTKCPKDLKPMEYRVLQRAMGLYPYQKLFFTSIEYCGLKALFGNRKMALSEIRKDTNILLLTGIASPQQIVMDIKPYSKNIHPMTFADHHQFTAEDIKEINRRFNSLPQPRMIVTTEKDGARLENADGLEKETKDNIFVLPIRVRFMSDGEKTFNNKIISYVRKNTRNSTMAERENDNSSADSHHPGHRSGTISFRNN